MIGEVFWMLPGVTMGSTGRSKRQGGVHAGRSAPRNRPIEPSPRLEQAAFELGFLSRSIWKLVRNHWVVGHLGFDARQDLSSLLEKIERYRLMLAPRMNGNVFKELPSELGRTGQVASILIDARDNPDNHPEINTDDWFIPSRSVHVDLCNLVDGAFSPDDSLNPLYWLGATLGDFDLAMDEEQHPRKVAGVYHHSLGIADLPDFRPVVSAAARVSDGLREAVPLLEKIADLTSAVEFRGIQSRALNSFLNKARKSYGCIGSTPYTLAGEVVDHLYDEIFEALGSPLHGIGEVLPSWDSESRTLRYGGEVARTIKQGSNVTIDRIVEAFQEAGWPEKVSLGRINDPDGPKIRQDQIPDQVKSLNDGLSFIKFSSTDSGASVAWSRA